MSRLRLALFDCDGTLVDSQGSIIGCVNAAWTAHGLTPPPPEAIRRGVGLRLEEAIARLAPDQPAAVLARLTQAYRDAFLDLRARGAVDESLYPGIDRLIADLDRTGWLLGIATGKGRAGLQRTLEAHDLADRFITLQTADRARGKPDPDMIYRAMAETGTDAQQVTMIGDTTYDILMAQNAGVVAIGVAWGYHPSGELRAAGAASVAEDADHLRQTLLRRVTADTA